VFIYASMGMNFESETLKTSWTLVARLKDLDDQDNWGRFYRLYRGLIMGVAVKAGLREDEAEVVVQETMASVSKNISGFEAGASRGSFHAWLLQLIRWRILDQLKRRMPAGGAGSETSSSTSTIARIPNPLEVDLDALCDAEWQQTLLTQAMNELQVEVSAIHYQAFHMLTVQQKSVGDTARLLGRSRPQIYLMKHRTAHALKKIVRRLQQRTEFPRGPKSFG
jgi:RNA polymerase sigma factor (sigma-70 family)